MQSITIPVNTTANIAYNKAEVGFDTHTPHAHALHNVGSIPGATKSLCKIDEKFWLDVEDSPG